MATNIWGKTKCKPNCIRVMRFKEGKKEGVKLQYRTEDGQLFHCTAKTRLDAYDKLVTWRMARQEKIISKGQYKQLSKLANKILRSPPVKEMDMNKYCENSLKKIKKIINQIPNHK